MILKKGQERAGNRRQQKRRKRDKALRTETLVQRGQAQPSSKGQERAESRGSRRYTREPGQERYRRARTGQEHDSRPSGSELNGNAHRKRLQAGEYEEGVVAIARHGGEHKSWQEESPRHRLSFHSPGREAGPLARWQSWRPAPLAASRKPGRCETHRVLSQKAQARGAGEAVKVAEGTSWPGRFQKHRHGEKKARRQTETPPAGDMLRARRGRGTVLKARDRPVRGEETRLPLEKMLILLNHYSGSARGVCGQHAVLKKCGANEGRNSPEAGGRSQSRPRRQERPGRGAIVP